MARKRKTTDQWLRERMDALDRTIEWQNDIYEKYLFKKNHYFEPCSCNWLCAYFIITNEAVVTIEAPKEKNTGIIILVGVFFSACFDIL